MERLPHQIRSRIAASQILWSDLSKLCSFGGRFAGTESERKARAFLKKRLAWVTQGAINVHEVDYSGWSRETCRLTRMTPGPLALQVHSLVRSASTPPGGIEAEVIDLGRGTLGDFEANKAEIFGRFVLVRHEYMFTTGHIHRRMKYQWAKERGAIGFLIASHLPGDLVVTGSSGGDEIPAAGTTQEAARALASAGRNYPRAQLEIRTRSQESVAQNLIAEIPGRTDEWVVLCAHYDGHDLAQSAIDNASGVAVVLAVADALASTVPWLRCGLRVALFTIEEWGLMGSRVYVDQMSDDERQKILAVINVDSPVGSPRLTALTSEFSALDSFAREVAESVGIPLTIHRSLMANSDHYNFARHGIPALRLVAGFDDPDSQLKYLLTRGDTLDKIDRSHLQTAALLAAAMTFAACAADRTATRARTQEQA